MLFVVRHGERVDFSFDPKEKSRTYNQYDPPLTSIGLKQSSITGAFLENSMKGKLPIIITSPFLRCVQTALQIADSFGQIYENTIFYEELLGEMLHRTWFPYNVNESLSIKSSKPKGKYEFVNGFINKKGTEGFLPQYPENFLDFFKRVQKCAELIAVRFFKEFDEKEHFLIIVTHGYAVQVLLRNYGAMQKLQNTEYCSITQIRLKNEGGYDILVPAAESHLNPKL